MNADENQAVLTERIIGALVEVSNTRGSGFLEKGEPPNTYGIGYPIPVAIEGLPAYVAMIVNDHLLNYPSSDLMDVLTGKEFCECGRDLEACATCATFEDPEAEHGDA